MSNIAHVQKVSWLKNWLDSLEFQIFTWHIDIGGPIESAIDWVLQPINGFVDWLNYALNWIEQAWDWVRDRVQALMQPWADLINIIQNTVSTWWSKLGDWWLAVWSGVQSWVDARVQPIRDWLTGVQSSLNSLWNQVTQFFSSILPTLASRFDVSDAINAAFSPWRDLFNFWGNTGKTLIAFFNNPVEFIWDRFNDWFFGG